MQEVRFVEASITTVRPAIPLRWNPNPLEIKRPLPSAVRTIGVGSCTVSAATELVTTGYSRFARWRVRLFAGAARPLRRAAEAARAFEHPARPGCWRGEQVGKAPVFVADAGKLFDVLAQSAVPLAQPCRGP